MFVSSDTPKNYINPVFFDDGDVFSNSDFTNG